MITVKKTLSLPENIILRPVDFFQSIAFTVQGHSETMEWQCTVIATIICAEWNTAMEPTHVCIRKETNFNFSHLHHTVLF